MGVVGALLGEGFWISVPEWWQLLHSRAAILLLLYWKWPYYMPPCTVSLEHAIDASKPCVVLVRMLDLCDSATSGLGYVL